MVSKNNFISLFKQTAKNIEQYCIIVLLFTNRFPLSAKSNLKNALKLLNFYRISFSKPINRVIIIFKIPLIMSNRICYFILTRPRKKKIVNLHGR